MSTGAFVAGVMSGIFIGLMTAAILGPPSPAPTYIPCAVPVYAVQASTLDELQARAELRMELMRHCGYLMQEARKAK